MIINIFIYWLTFLPLVVFKNGYENPKVFYYLVGCIGIIFFWLYQIIKHKKDFEFKTPDFFYLLWLLILLVSSIFGIHPFESIIGGSYRHQGVIFFFGLWLVGKSITSLSTSQKNKLSRAVGMVILIEALIVSIQYLSGYLYFGKPLGTIGENNAVAGFLVIGIYFVQENFPKFYLVPLYILVLISESRSALLSLATFSIFYLEKIKPLFKYSLVFLIILFSLLGTLYVSKGKTASVFEDRSLIWQISVNKISNKFIFGYGAETGEVVFDNAFRQMRIPLEGLIIDRAHNLFLDVLMWSGIVGLVFFSGWFLFSFKMLGSSSKKFAILSFLVYSILQPLSIVHWILLVIIINI